MAVSGSTVDLLTPLLQNDAVHDATDYRGDPAVRSNTGGWKSAFFIIGVETAERIAFYGVGSNLISYLTGPLGQSTAAAAAAVNAWFGASALLPLLGATIADSFLGRFPTIFVASLLYILGLSLLTVSAVMWSGAKISPNDSLSSSSTVQVALFFLSLYLVALGQGGHKPCVQAFGADQFDSQDSKESKARSSFFNWWYFGMNSGMLFSYSVIFYIQDNASWGLGFGIPCILMLLGLLVFLLGRRTYRYQRIKEDNSPFTRIGHWFANLARNWRSKSISADVNDSDASLLRLEFANEELAATSKSHKDGKSHNAGEAEDAKVLLRLFPVWVTCLGYAVAFSQSGTFFTKQGVTMDRSTGISNFIVPAASLQSFTTIAVMLSIFMYDALLVPTARSLTGKPSGITMLQRIGTGMFISTVAMVIAALVEVKRLETAIEHGLVNSPEVTLPMSFWWLVPQYVLNGVSEAFTMVGLQEFFYSQVPDELRSVGLSLYLSIFGIGSLLSSLVVSVIDGATSRGSRDSWFSDNLNRGHVDYFYWLLAGLQFVGMVIFLYYSKSYVYRRKVLAV